MNEEALKDAYGLFTQSGYNGTQDEFYTLLSDNAEAFADSYGLFKGSGYSGSEDDYKELLGLKKKDSSELPDAVAQTDSGVSPSVSEDGQSSLEQNVQISLEERLAKRKSLPIEEQIALSKQDELRPFYEAQGLNLDDKLNFEAIKKSKAEEEKKEKESEQELSFFSKLYNRITSTEDLEEDFQVTDEDNANQYLANNEEKIFEAEKQYNIAKAKEITQVFSPDQRKEQFEEQGVDLGYMPTSFIKVNGEDFSVKELQKNLYDSEFIDKLQSEEVNVDIDNSIEDETLQSLIDLRDRQKESGGQWGDIAQSFYAGALDLLVAGPLEAIETLVMPRGYKEIVTSVVGGTLGKKVNKYANKVRENTRVYQEEGMTKSLLKGNWSDAMFQTGNALSESAPLILSMYASAPLKLSQGVTLGFAGVSAGGLKSLELKEQRLKGEIDMSDAQILLNSVLTGGAEAFFERFTLDAVNASRKVFALGKITPGEIAEGFTKGFLRQARVEGLSEGATELSNMFTDLITRDIDYEKGELKDTAIGLEDVAVRFSDAAMIGSIMGGGIHTVPYMAKSMSKFKILDENIAVLFTMEDGSTQSMSRADALKFVKNPEVAERVRSGAVTMDASMNDIAKQQVEEILYGFYAPDAVASREVMREKEGGVQSILDKIRDAEEVSTEDVNGLSKAVSEMEAEGKKSKYNISESTKATRSKLSAILKQKGIQIVDAVASQDVSMSKVTETVDATKIDSQEQYNSVKRQLEDGKRKPTVVQSQNQSGIKVNNEVSQTSEITQGKFKSVSAARNAMKDFEAKRDAAKKGEMLESDIFPANNKLFLNTKKETLDEIPQEVIDNNDYHILTSEKEGLTQGQRASRMERLKSMLDEAGATYYTVQGVYNGVAEESLVVTGIDNATALNLGNQFQQESIFSSKDGLMFGDGRIVPLDGGMIKGPDARKKQDVTIMNVGGRKVSMHTGLDKLKTSYGKNFNSDNIHKLDESNANYDAELFQGLDESRKRSLGFAFKLLNSIGGLNVTVVRNSKAMEEQLKAIGQSPSKKMGSFFRGADKTIYVNLETARGNTLFHEIIHPMVDFIKKTDPALYKRIEAEVKESDIKRRVMKDGRRMKGSYLDWAKANYEGLSEEALVEEAFAEMMGDAAYGHFVNKQSKLTKIREVIREILSRIGVVSPFENVEAIDLNQMSLSDIRTNLSEALINGRKINVGGVEFEVGDVDKLSEIREKNPTLFSEPNPETADISKSYLSDKATDLGIDQYSEPRFVNRLNEDNSKMIADAYDSLVDDPKNPEVIKAYKALADETLSQYQSIIDKGYKLEIWKGKGEPYANSTEMIQDVRDNKHLYIFGTEAGFGEGAITPEQRKENVMLSRTEYKDVNGDPLVVNDIFRFVHDFFGHTELGNGFGPIGEENAWLNHSRMYSPEARKAMTTETRGQNSWVNYNKNIRRKDGTIPKKGEKGYVPLSERPFADQKMGILPDNIVNPVEVKAEDISDIRMQASEVAEEYVNDLDQKIKSTRNSKELQRLLDIKSGLAFRSGDLTTKAESKFKMRQGRGTGHFGTGFYFFSDLNRAKAYDDRRVSVINLNNYNLAPGTIKLHDALKSINNNSFDRDVNKYEIFGREIKEVESITGINLTSEQRSQFVNDINLKLNDTNNIDSPSTLIMKSLGFEGIDSRYNKDTDNSTYGTVIYDIKYDQVGDIRMQAPEVKKVQWQKSKIGRGDLAITNRREEVRKAAQDYFDGKINQEEYLEIVQENSPIKPITQFIDPASLEDIETAVGSKVEGRLDVPIQEGTKVGLRLDIPAYTNKNIWAITVHEDGRGKAMSYTNVARINNVEFISSPKVALGIARGKLSKSTIARMLGNWSPIEGTDAKARGENAKQIVTEVMNDPSWSQVGMNPFRHSYFYDRLDGMPVVGAEQVVQIGGLVYAKNAQKTTPFDERFEDKRTGLRFQAPQEEGENVVYTSGLTTIAFDIAQAVVDADYKAGKYTTKAIASIPFLKIDKPRKQFEGYDIRLSKLLFKPFGSHSNEEIKEIMVRNRGDLQAELLRVDDNLRLLKNTIQDSNITPEQVNDLLHNVEDIKAMEKSELRTALIEMRTHIDELSRTLIREGLVAGQTMFTIDSNMGLYITRSYRQFETKNWEQTDNDIIQNAKDFLYREVKNQNIRDVKDGKIDKDGNLITLMSEDAILNKAQEAYDKLVEEKDFLKFSGGSSSLEGLTRVNSIFMQKKVIPEEIRELWGEIDSPLINYSNTISKVAKTISAERMYRELNNIGQGKFISDNYDRLSTRNKLEGSKWGDLDGKWVDDEMYVVMNQVNRTFEKNRLQQVYDAYMQIVLFNKKMKTVWNPGTHAKNIIGNSSFAMMNGHLSPDFKQMYQDGKLAIQAFKTMKSEEFKELYDKLTRQGVVLSSASLAEIQNISEDLRNNKFDLTEYLKDKNGEIQKRMAKVSGTIREEISSFDEKLMKAYQAEDDVWKIFGYLSERGRYIKAGLDVAVAEEMAAKNIRNLYPNYNEIPRIIRLLGRSPLVGSFVAFQAESVRNAKNTVMLGFEEMGSDNPKIRRIGATRIAGTIATMTLMEGLQLYTAQFLGEFLGFGGEDDDDVERRKMRLLLPEWDAPGNIAYMFRGFLESKQSEDQTERDRYFDYINFSSISGVGYIKDIMRLAFTDIDTQLGQDTASNILKKIYAPFLGEEMTGRVMLDAVNNKGGKIFKDTDGALTKLGKMIVYVGNKVQPGAGRVLQRGVESAYDEDSDLVPGYEMLAIFGIRINRVNVNKGLAIKSNFLHKDMISRVGKEVLKDPFALREEARSNSRFNEDLNKLADLIAAARLNSINGENVKTILYNSRVSKPVIEEAYSRYLDRYLEDAISVDDK